MKRLAIASLMALSLGTAAAAQSLSPSQFTEKVAAALRAQAPSLAVTVKGAMEVQVKDPTGEERTIYLDNAYRLYSADPNALQGVVDNYVRSFMAPLITDAPIDRSRVVPVIKDRPWLSDVRAAMRARGGPELAENLVEDLNKDLVIVYAEDSPRNIRFLTASNLTELGIEKEHLRALAVANLRRLVPTPEVTRGPLVSMIVAGGDYEASLLLFDELWSGGPVSVDGEIVVAIPARNILLFAGSRNKAGIARLRQLASKYAREAPYRLTGRLFVFRGGRFVPFDK